jgi:hypothetical protein
MRATGRRQFVIAVLASFASAHAAAHDQVIDLFAAMSAALSTLNPDGFIVHFDKDSPDRDHLANSIPALLSQGDVSSSIEFVSDDGDDAKRTVKLDWYLEIKAAAPVGPLIQRRKIVTCQIEKKNNKWLVETLSPLSLFDPISFT